MEVPTNFKSFKSKGLKVIADIKQAWRDRDYKWLSAFFFVAIVTIIVGFSIAFSSVITSLEKFGILKENIYALKSELTYEIKSETKMENGNYQTIFLLKFSAPPNHLGERMLFNAPYGCDTENIIATPVRGVDIKNGAQYATSEYEVSCITSSPIIDNLRKDLFILTK